MASNARKKLLLAKPPMAEPCFNYTEPERQSLLDRARELKMARSTHAYVRGNTAKFYDWLAGSPSANSACLSDTFTEMFPATASARRLASSISPSWTEVSAGSFLFSFA